MINLDRLCRQVEELPPLPSIAMKALELSGNPSKPLKEIVEIAELDPAITMRVLRICNSPYHGLPRAVNSLEEALILIGLNPLVNAILASSVAGVFIKAQAGYGLARGALWRHSVACAIASDMIASRLRGVTPSQAFTGGLLHDVGKTILATYVEEEFENLLRAVEKKGISFMQAEREILGFTHADVGGRVAEFWGLPALLKNAIQFHHEPSQGPDESELAAVVHVANALCLSFGFGVGFDGLAFDVDKDTLDVCQIDSNEIMLMAAEVLERCGSAEEMISISGGA